MSEERKNIFEDQVATKDENLELEQLLSDMKSKNLSTKEEPKKEVEVVKEKELSPLELLKKEQERNKSGLVVSNEELEKGRIQTPNKNIVYNDERMGDFQKAIDSYDDSMKKRNAIIVTKQPTNEVEYIGLTLEMESVVFDENGKASFNLKDSDGNPVEPKYCRLRREDEDVFDYSTLSEFEKSNLPQNQETKTESTNDSTETKKDEISEEKRKIVEVLIDKTGMGAEFNFTDSEREKLSEAEIIKVNEVKVIDIAAIKSKRNDKSFQDVVKEYNVAGSRVTIFFPASGFKAQMKGLSYGEYADIQISMENLTVDTYMKRLSIIYNKMTNISTGPFKDFEDFLKKFAYTDIALAIYGLFVATESEEQEIALRCGNEECDHTFNWKFGARGVLKLDRCADTFISKMDELVKAPAKDYDKIKAESAVETSKLIELPESKFVVEMGIASAYDYLYNFVPLMNETTFKEAFGDNVNAIYQDNVLLLTTVRSVYVPLEDGSYTECTGYKDILDALYNIKPREIQILAAYTSKLISDYEITFSFGDVVCPHCKNVTEKLDVSIDELVFQTYQRLMSTEVDLKSILDF